MVELVLLVLVVRSDHLRYPYGEYQEKETLFMQIYIVMKGPAVLKIVHCLMTTQKQN